MNPAENKFDIIIIGSGMGGLACASILSRMRKKKVLVLERHFKIGGFTHVFKRKGKYEWDVGIHYIGQMHRGSTLRAIFDYITDGKLAWNRMPDVYDVFVYPDQVFKARSGRRNLQQDLIGQFPQEKNAIEQYFDDVKKASKWLSKYFMASALPKSLDPVSSLLTKGGSELALMTTGEYLNRHFRDQKLKAVLVSQWGDYGLPPQMSAFGIHAMVAGHYFSGGWFPVGGSKKIADSIIPLVEEPGGKMLVNHKATEIIIRNGKAVGVKVQAKQGNTVSEEEYFADVIISDAGAYITYNELLPPEQQPSFLEEIRNFPKGVSHVTLHLGLGDDPRKIGFRGENYWIYSSYDHDKIYEARNELIDGKVTACYVSFPSLKNPLAKAHTMEIIAFLDYEPFKKWAAQPWKKRDEEYEQLKEKISLALIDFADSRITAFKSLIDYYELSTPLTTETFTGHRRGNIYGLPAIPERFKLNWLGPRTPVTNLYLTGTDASSHGIAGALMGGVLTSGITMGSLGVMKIFSAVKKFSQSLK